MIAHNNNNDGDTVVDDGLSLCDDDEEQGAAVPMSERLTHTQADTNRRNAKEYKRFTLSLLFVTFLVSVVVVTVRNYGNVGSRRSSSSQSNGEEDGSLTIWDIFFGNGHTEQVNKVRLQQTLDYLIEHKISNPDTLLVEDQTSYEDYAYLNIGTGHSPQYEAALWIAKIDKARMVIPTVVGTSTTDDATTPTKEEEEEDSLFSNNINGRDNVVSYDYPFIQRYSLAVLFFATGGDSSWYWKSKIIYRQFAFLFVALLFLDTTM